MALTVRRRDLALCATHRMSVVLGSCQVFLRNGPCRASSMSETLVAVVQLVRLLHVVDGDRFSHCVPESRSRLLAKKESTGGSILVSYGGRRSSSMS